MNPTEQEKKQDGSKPNAGWANWALLQAWFTRQSQGTPIPDSERPALAELMVERFAALAAERGSGQHDKAGPRCFVIIATGGYWGKGKTMEEAAKNSKAGAKEKAFVYMVLNADIDKVWIDGYGAAHCDSPGSLFLEVGKTTIGGILNANKAS